MVLVVLCAVAPSAGAVTLISGRTGQPMGGAWPRWVAAMHVPTVDGDVTVNLVATAAQTPCYGEVPQIEGCAQPGEIWLVEDFPAWAQRQALEHELGHEFFFTGRVDEAAFERAYGLATPWATPFNVEQGSANEWFAEAYRMCADRGPHVDPGWISLKAEVPQYTVYGFPGLTRPGALAKACRLIDAS